jgi:hypothetical protein
LLIQFSVFPVGKLFNMIIQVMGFQVQSFAEGVSKTTKHKVLDLKQLKQRYLVVIQSKLFDIF